MSVSIDKNILLQGDMIHLRPVTISDISQRYIDWLNDRKVTEFMGLGDTPATHETIKAYFDSLNNDNNLFLAIITNQKGIHIGNVRLGPTDWVKRTSALGVLIGDRSFWGQGLATAALRLVLDQAFNVMRLEKVSAAVIVENESSLRLFDRVGFTRGQPYKATLVDGSYREIILFTLARGEFKNHE